MQEHLFRHFSSPGRNGFFNVSITFIRQILQILLNEKTIGEELSKPWHLLGLILKAIV